MSTPHVLVLYNDPTLPPDHPDFAAEAEVLETVEFVAGALQRAGHSVSRLAISDDPTPLIATLRGARQDVIFNLHEGTASHGQTEAYVAGLLEWLRVPYTGCPFQTIALARDKPLTKLMLQGAGLPTPRFQVIDSTPIPACPLRWPVIVKLATEDASIGIDQGSVVASQTELDRRAVQLLDRYRQPVLVEEYIDGRELNVAIIETDDLQVLPISEIVFGRAADQRWNIVSYDAKWLPGSTEDLATVPRCPAELAEALAEQLRQLAARAFRLLGCRDYARVDFRLNSSNEAFILEVNPNPDFHPTAGLARSLRVAGVAHEEFAVQLIHRAKLRSERET